MQSNSTPYCQLLLLSIFTAVLVYGYQYRGKYPIAELSLLNTYRYATRGAQFGISPSSVLVLFSSVYQRTLLPLLLLPLGRCFCWTILLVPFKSLVARHTSPGHLTHCFIRLIVPPGFIRTFDLHGSKRSEGAGIIKLLAIVLPTSLLLS